MVIISFTPYFTVFDGVYFRRQSYFRYFRRMLLDADAAFIAADAAAIDAAMMILLMISHMPCCLMLLSHFSMLCCLIFCHAV